MSITTQDMEKTSNTKVLSDEDDTSIEIQQKAEPRFDQKDGTLSTDASQTKPLSENQDTEIEYVSGWRLFLATGIVALACFTMLLDTSIIVTVSQTAVEGK